jgi:hypothetical protein
MADIRHVLVNVWDPIGLKDAFNLEGDEYDCCVGPVATLLLRHASDDEIAEYLWRQGTEHMGLDLQKQELYAIVAALRKIDLGEN